MLCPWSCKAVYDGCRFGWREWERERDGIVVMNLPYKSKILSIFRLDKEIISCPEIGTLFIELS